MKKTVLFMTFFALILRGVTIAQNPYESIGKKAKVLTLSNGKYQEIFTNDTIVPIGSVMYNRVTGDIVAFITRDTMYAEYNLEPEVVSRWLSPDPLGAKFPQNSPYVYANNNPILFIDPDGQEPIKPLAGTVCTVVSMLNNTPSNLGQQRGSNAESAMLKLGSTEWNWKQMKPLPTTTPYFNNKEGRYLYTAKGGWVDMVHFLFYAGKAYENKKNGEKNPIGEAMQEGYKQEATDPAHSAYSYEDLASDKFGAEFAVKHFDPNSDTPLADQIEKYLTETLGATNPENAPNWNQMPTTDSKNPPTATNKTTTPMYTTDTQNNNSQNQKKKDEKN